MDISRTGHAIRLNHALYTSIVPQLDCLLWAGEFKDGIAVFKDTVFTGKKFAYSFEIIILELAKRKYPYVDFSQLQPEGQEPNCGNPGCVRPEHWPIIQKVLQ